MRRIEPSIHQCSRSASFSESPPLSETDSLPLPFFSVTSPADHSTSIEVILSASYVKPPDEYRFAFLYEITPEQVALKVPKEATDVYVKIDENKIYWVGKNGETGALDIW